MAELKTKILDEYMIKIEEAYGVQTISVYNKDNKYVGDLEDFKNLVEHYGITKIQTYNDNNVCSIGFNEKENRWYGWSHRAIHSFGVGDEVKEHDLTNTSGYVDSYIKEHPEKDLSLPVGFKAKNLEDAKRMAIAFADSVA